MKPVGFQLQPRRRGGFLSKEISNTATGKMVDYDLLRFLFTA